jgi:hypothetical protein
MAGRAACRMPFVVHFRGLDLHHLTPHVSFPIDLSVPQNRPPFDQIGWSLRVVCALRSHSGKRWRATLISQMLIPDFARIDPAD